MIINLVIGIIAVCLVNIYELHRENKALWKELNKLINKKFDIVENPTGERKKIENIIKVNMEKRKRGENEEHHS